MQFPMDHGLQKSCSTGSVSSPYSQYLLHSCQSLLRSLLLVSRTLLQVSYLRMNSKGIVKGTKNPPNKVLSTEHITSICLNEHEYCVPSEEPIELSSGSYCIILSRLCIRVNYLHVQGAYLVYFRARKSRVAYSLCHRLCAKFTFVQPTLARGTWEECALVK